MPRREPCIYCGYPTAHPSHTCPAHRDLVRPLPGLDSPYEEPPPISKPIFDGEADYVRQSRGGAPRDSHQGLADDDPRH